MRFYIFVFLFFIQSTGLYAQASQPVLITANLEKKEIGFSEINYIPAGDSITNLLQARDYFNHGYFIANNGRGINLGIAKDNYWVRILLINATNSKQAYYLCLENPHLNEVDVFFLQQGHNTNYVVGDDFPFENRSVYHSLFAFHLEFEKADSIEAYFFIKHKGNSLQLPISLYSKNKFLQTTESEYLFFGITIGMLIIILVFCVFLLFNTFSRLFLFYGLYITSVILWLWATEGYGFQYFWPWQPEWATRFGPGFSITNLLAFTLVVLAFCKPYDANSLWRKLISYSVVVMCVWAIIPFLPIDIFLTPLLMATFLRISFSIYILVLVNIIGYLCWLSFKKNRLVLYYLSAVIISISSTLIVIAKNTGWIHLYMSSGRFMSTGIILEVVLMTAGITRQFYIYKKEKELALLANVEQQKSINIKILQMQEAERRRISSELHDDLGSGLTQITLIGEHAKQQIKKGLDGIDELDNISETSRKLVEKVSEIIWTMNPQNNSLSDLLVYLREQSYKMLEYTSIEYEIDMAEVDESIVLTNDQRRSIILLTKEIIHNIIKHSNAKNVKTEVTFIKNCLKLVISDDGIGFDTSQRTRGNGLRNMNQRAGNIGGSLTIESEIGKGTVHTFSVLLNSHL